MIRRASIKLGYSSLRENQLKAVKRGNDVIVILPTGSGKSLCFWLLPFAFDYLYERVGSIVVVVSPLIALMYVRCMWSFSCSHSLLASLDLIFTLFVSQGAKGGKRPPLEDRSYSVHA